MRGAQEKMINFKVGCTESLFVVPENRIRASSEFVDAAMRGPWQESQQRAIALPDFNRRTFGIYAQWLLTGVVHSKQRRTSDDGGRSSPLYNSLKSFFGEILTLARLSDLGHYLLDTDFRDALSDVLVQCTCELLRIGCPFPPNYGSKFYRRTPSGPPTRRLVVDLATSTLRERNLPGMALQRDEWDPEYTMDLFLAVAVRHISKTPGKTPFDGWETSCKYHCHGDEKPCYRKKAEMYDTSLTKTQLQLTESRSSNPTKKRSAAEDAELPNTKRQA